MRASCTRRSIPRSPRFPSPMARFSACTSSKDSARRRSPSASRARPARCANSSRAGWIGSVRHCPRGSRGALVVAGPARSLAPIRAAVLAAAAQGVLVTSKLALGLGAATLVALGGLAFAFLNRETPPAGDPANVAGTGVEFPRGAREGEAQEPRVPLANERPSDETREPPALPMLDVRGRIVPGGRQTLRGSRRRVARTPDARRARAARAPVSAQRWRRRVRIARRPVARGFTAATGRLRRSPRVRREHRLAGEPSDGRGARARHPRVRQGEAPRRRPRARCRWQGGAGPRRRPARGRRRARRTPPAMEQSRRDQPRPTRRLCHRSLERRGAAAPRRAEERASISAPRSNARRAARVWSCASRRPRS
jgi:hypothetical protein